MSEPAPPQNTPPVTAATRAAWKLSGAIRLLRGRVSGRGVERSRVELTSTVGYRLRAERVRPVGSGPLPGIVISPAIHQGITQLLGNKAVVGADEIARLGFVVLVHDPAGRGESWGEEDFGGPEHQDNLRVAIAALHRDPTCTGEIGVVSLSLGIAAAVGALVGPESKVVPRWLVDWEGPCDREIITAGGKLMVPAAGHTLTDESYWQPREAVRAVGKLPCGYVRLQARPDHAQPDEVRHALRMMRAAESGEMPWFQINDHPRGEVPERPAWAPGGPFAANQLILRKLRNLRAGMQ